MLRISGLKKQLGAFSLSINKLEISVPGIYGLIGPNGCGKTTAAKLICGILAPDKGEICFTLENGDAASERDITMVSQKPYMMNDTVYNNLVYPLKLRGMAANKRSGGAVGNEYLAKIGFLERKNQRARLLSAGERQKLALLRAMIFKPRLIILDEAMTDLDIDSLDMFEGLALDRQKEDPVIWIIISHQIAHIRRLCDYVFFMSAGNLEAAGPLEELLESPNPFICEYFKHA